MTILLSACCCFLVQLVAAPLASAGGEKPKPAVSIAGSDSLMVHISEVHPGWKSWTGALQGEMRVTLYNSGTQWVHPVFALVPDGTDESCPDNGFTVQAPAREKAVRSHASTTYDLSIGSVDRGCVGDGATLLVTGDPAIDTVTAPVKTQRVIGWWQFGPPLLVALVAFLLVVLVAGGASRRGHKLDGLTPAGASWSFSGSWLTSVSALATALAGVLAAGGFISELLPGVPLGNFLGLSLVFTGLVVAAPLAFSVFQVTGWQLEDDPTGAKDADDKPLLVKVPVLRGRLIGFLVGASMTSAGVAGLLTMLAVLAGLSDADTPSKVVVGILLLVVLLAVAGYVVTSLRHTIKASESAPDEEERKALDSIRPSNLTRVSRPSHESFSGTL